MEWKKKVKRISSWFAIATLALLLIVGGLFALAQTDPGKRLLGTLIAEVLSLEGERRLELGKIEGLLPFRFSVAYVRVSDSSGKWLEVEGINGRIDPSSLLKGHVRIRDVSASKVDLVRIPVGQERSEMPSQDIPSWFAAIRKLKVEQFSIQEMALGEAILGQRALFHVQARMIGQSPEGGSTASLRIERRDGHRGLATIESSLREDNTLGVDVAVDEPEAGLVGAMLGTREPLSITLRGEGPLTGWAGVLAAKIGLLWEARADIRVDRERGGGLSARGSLVPGAKWAAAPIGEIIGKEGRFSLDARLGEKGMVIVDLLSLDADHAGATLKGSFDTARMVCDGEFTIRLDDLTPLLKGILQTHSGGRLSLDGRIKGPLFNPEINMGVKAEALEVERFRMRLVQGHVDLHPSWSFHPSSPRLSLSGQGKAHGIHLRRGASVPEHDLRWRLSMEGPFEDGLHIRELRLEGEGYALGLSGKVAEDGSKLSLAADMVVPDLSRFFFIPGARIPGTGHMEAVLQGNGREGNLHGRIRGRINLPEKETSLLLASLGGEIIWKGDLLLREGKQVSVSEFRVETPIGSCKGRGSLEIPTGKWSSTWEASLPDLGPVGGVTGWGLGGSAEVEGRMEGTFSKVSFLGRAGLSNFMVRGLMLKEARVDISAAYPDLQGRLSLESRLVNGILKGATDYSVSGDHLRLSGLTFKWPGSETIGSLNLDLRKGVAEGELSGKCADLSSLSPLTGKRLGGSADVKARFTADKGGQGLTLLLKAKDLATPLGETERAALRIQVARAFQDPQGSIGLEVKNYRHGTVSLSSLEMSGEGGMGRLPFRVKATGRFREAFDLEASALFSKGPGRETLVIQQLNSRFGELPITLLSPGVITRSEAGLAMDSIKCMLGKGRIEGAWNMGKAGVGAALRFDALPLDFLRAHGVPPIRGNASGDLELSGTPDRPEAKINIRLTELGLEDARFRELPAAGLEGKVELRGGRVSSLLSFQGLSERPFRVGLEFPAVVTLSPLAVTIPHGSGISGGLDGEIDLSRIHVVLGLGDQDLMKGKTKVRLGIGGTVDEPKIDGVIRVERGVYENLRTGTLLQDIEVEAGASSHRLLIKKAEATDGVKGSIKARGWMDLLPSKGFPFEVKGDLAEIMILRRDDASASATGALRLSGSLRKATLSGDLLVNRGDFRIPEHLPPEMEPLDVKAPRQMRESGQGGEKPEGRGNGFLSLDVAVRSPGKVLFTGRGLESEWQGDLRMTGEAAAPALLGRLSVVRGGFDFLGKRFDIKKGAIDFSGTNPPAPVMDVLATATAKDVTARVEVLGPVSSPRVKLSSEPLLPADEILSRLLFGHTAARITPFQAVQLANALNTLKGGTGVDLVGHTRRILGFDQLEVKQSRENRGETVISAGKYVGENVYIEVERGLGMETGKASVKWEVTPNVSIETEVGAHAEKGAGIFWKWDY